MRLSQKFNLVVLVLMSLSLAAMGGIIYWQLTAQERTESVEKAQLLLNMANSVRGYTSERVSPLLGEMLQDATFHPETVPSFAAQSVLRLIGESAEFEGFSYREVALNPTVPSDRADAWQAEVLNRFRTGELSGETAIERDRDTGSELTVWRPIQIQDEGCLYCHGDPAEAPEVMVRYYGDQNGFGWQMGEIVAAQVVSVPQAASQAEILQLVAIVMAALAGLALIGLLILNALLHRIIVRPIGQLSAMAEQVSTGDLSTPEYEARSKDEIGSLAQSFNRMRRSLVSAMRMLEE